MSPSLSQRSSGTPANPTRQQLDELDALLQRMMDLPVNKLEDADPPGARQTPPVSYTTPNEAADAHAAAPQKIDFQALKQRLEAMPQLMDERSKASAGMTGPDSEEVANDDNWVPLSSTWQPSSLTWKPLAQSWQQPPEQSSAEVPTSANEHPVEEPAPAAVSQPASTKPAAHPLPAVESNTTASASEWTSEAPIARWAAPLVWFNDGFDRCLTPLGPVGRFLRSPAGRLGLAIVGLGCLVAAIVVLLIDWIGWTS
jgi:hypothetical protein